MIILKIIGISLLVILGLILLALLYMLFAPIGYDIVGRWNGSRYVRFRIHDLLRIVSGKIVYDMQSGLQVSVRLFGFKELAGGGEPEADEEVEALPEDISEDAESESGQKRDEAAEIRGEKVIGNHQISTSVDRDADIEDSVSGNEELDNVVIDDVETEPEADDREADEEPPDDEKKKSPVALAKEYLTKQNIDAIKFMLGCMMGFIKRTLPHIKHIRGDYSLGSPDLTGQSYGLFACFPFMYKKGNYLNADFESGDLYFDGELIAKGRIKLCWLVGAFIRILLNKDSRTLIFKVIGG